MTTNNATRLLNSRKIPYQAFDLPVEKIGALETAQILKVPVGQVFKTIVIIREKSNKPLLAVIPGDREVDLKSLANKLGEKKVHLPTQREAEKITGLKAGGISPLVLIHKGFQVILDEAAMQYSEIHISGGQLGLNIRLPVSALIELTHAQLGSISKPSFGQNE
ncbi:MAG: Cys-tRNA(Pro) deacylase [Anaerolineae bacterium]|nr:Cys-tRNA(Pro) deacylase [Anaerolineae bacterium]